MKIRVKIKAIIVNPKTPLRAVASVSFDDSFVIYNIRIIERGGRLTAAMPSVRNGKGKWINVCHPLKLEMRRRLDAACAEAYRNYTDNPGVSEPEAAAN